MAHPSPLPHDDDPFADSFGEFGGEEVFAEDPSPDAHAAAFDAEAAAAEPHPIDADAHGELQPADAHPLDAQPAGAEQLHDASAGMETAAHVDVDPHDTSELLLQATAPAPGEPGRAKGFDWFGHFRKGERPAEPEALAPDLTLPLPALDFEIASPAASLEPLAPVSPAPIQLEPSAFADDLEDAPSVPARFDDAVTQVEPEPFADFDAAEPVFAYADPEPAPNPVAAMIASAEAALGDAAVPRIAIHVFCQKAETAAMAQAAAADRRLQRASTAVRPGGLPEALALYATSPTPALVIVENTAPALQLLADLDRLSEVCDPGTKVVVIGEANDITLYRELMRRGVSEYLVPPLQPLQLIRTISGLYADPDTPFVGRTIAFVGAKGGVGSSTLAHNFAWCMAERVQANTCVVDYDLAFGTAGLDFNQDPVNGLYDALSKPDRVDAVLMDRMMSRCTDRLSLFAAPATLDDDYDIGADAYEEVGGKIRSAAPYVVLDLPHVWSAWMRRTLISADDVVLVAQPDLASLRNGKNILELIGKSRANDAPPRLVLNQVGLPGRPEIPVKDFAKAMGVEPALVVPFDAKLFGQAANNGQMIGEVNDKAKASEGLLAFAQTLTRREAAPVKSKSLIDRLVKRG